MVNPPKYDSFKKKKSHTSLLERLAYKPHHCRSLKGPYTLLIQRIELSLQKRLQLAFAAFITCGGEAILIYVNLCSSSKATKLYL